LVVGLKAAQSRAGMDINPDWHALVRPTPYPGSGNVRQIIRAASAVDTLLRARSPHSSGYRLQTLQKIGYPGGLTVSGEAFEKLLVSLDRLLDLPVGLIKPTERK